MTIGNAMKFIERGLADSALRYRLNSATDPSELENVLSAEKLTFSTHDLDEAFNHRLTQCQEEDEANQINEFKSWWNLLTQSLGMPQCGNQCNGSC